MATRLYANTANGTLETVIEGVGVANSAGIVNLSIDLATSVADGAGGTRAITKAEVVESLVVLTEYIIRSNWTPA
jgi:hypothetical protein